MTTPDAERTIILQSHRADPPPPITTCIDTVRAWASDAGHDYAFERDELFNRLPSWFVEAVADNRLMMSDLARLLWLREQLDRYDLAVWIDADVLVFAPERFAIHCGGSYGVCRETWIRRGGRGQFLATHGLHNALLAFRRNNPLLDFYIYACGALVHNRASNLVDHALGPDLLGRFADVLGANIIPNVGLFSPVVTAAVAAGKGRAVAAYRAAHGEPVYAANMCASFLGRPANDGGLTPRTLERAITKLLKTGGAIVNGY